MSTTLALPKWAKHMPHAPFITRYAGGEINAVEFGEGISRVRYQITYVDDITRAPITIDLNIAQLHAIIQAIEEGKEA